MSNLVESKQKSDALWLTKFNIKDAKVVIKDAKFDAVDSIENSKCSNILIFYWLVFLHYNPSNENSSNSSIFQ